MPETNPILNRLVEANTGFVHALALRLAPAPGLADDIAQQVFLELFGRESTRIDVSAGTELKLASLKRGKRSNLLSGTIQASVARQRPLWPMIVTTPNAEARVLGTRFTLTATTNRTRLDVAEGRVRFTRTSDGAAVKVGVRHYAVVATSTELAALPQTGALLREIWTGIPG